MVKAPPTKLYRWGTTVNEGTTGPVELCNAQSILFHGSCTVARTERGIYTSGHDPLLPSVAEFLSQLSPDQLGKTRITERGGRPFATIIGKEVFRPIGGEAPGVELESEQHGESADSIKWSPCGTCDDMAATAYAVLSVQQKSVFRHEDISDLMKPEKGENIKLPIVGRDDRVRVYTTETRAFILSSGRAFELVFDHTRVEDVGRVWLAPYELVEVEELSGLNVRLYPGHGNRVGAVSEAGDVFVLESEGRGGGVVMLRWPGEEEDEESEEGEDGGDNGNVQDDGYDSFKYPKVYAGDGYTMVLNEKGLWARGDNSFGQLGQGHTDPIKGWIKIDIEAGDVVDIAGSPYSAVAIVRPHC